MWAQCAGTCTGVDLVFYDNDVSTICQILLETDWSWNQGYNNYLPKEEALLGVLPLASVSVPNAGNEATSSTAAGEKAKGDEVICHSRCRNATVFI